MFFVPNFSALGGGVEISTAGVLVCCFLGGDRRKPTKILANGTAAKLIATSNRRRHYATAKQTTAPERPKKNRL
ncbi:hypothetical protein CHX27_14055 [Flavobacterium aurantiibacter]|uniref:Uncharacterized protein n=1 Tax=Flavobacterium aurantiibacter TaxID=2023067 RepID=A0A255ZDI1_9FLAO|nr:hypothetical protein CHX27_14055 [Flavobacterium aurantiibacter]